MKSFTVHQNASSDDDDSRLVLVREGFSWTALFVPVLWLIYRRVWIGLPAYAVVCLVCVGLVWLTGYDPKTVVFAAGLLLVGPLYLVTLADPVASVFGLGLAFLLAAEANDLWRRWLAMEGYEIIDIVAGKTLSEAERAYFGLRAPPESAPKAT